MERLTDLIAGNDNEYCTYIATEEQVLNKLGKLEDIMEKYGIESEQELGGWLEHCHKQGCELYRTKFNVEIWKHDRDIWKRACELACNEIKILYDKFYAEAQKELKK